MNFIRNIIAEKRSARPQGLPIVAEEPTEDRDTSHRTAQFNSTIAATQKRVDLTGHEPGFDGNMFASDFEEISELTEAKAPHARFERDDRTPDMDFAPTDEQAAQSDAARPGLAPTDKAGDERVLRKAMLAAAAEVSAPYPAADPVRQSAPQPDLSEMPFVSAQARSRSEDVLTDAGVQIPPPAQGRGASRSGRVKTRLLGFNPENLGLANPFEKADPRAHDSFPVGWLVVVDGPGRGMAFALHDGVSRIGRGEDQAVCLNFGDNSISRENHLSIAYDGEQNAFYIGQNGRSNIVRLNNKPVLSTEQMRGGDQVRVGETTLRLAVLCSDDFSWIAKS